MDRENFGEVLRQAREAQGLTKTELASRGAVLGAGQEKHYPRKCRPSA